MGYQVITVFHVGANGVGLLITDAYRDADLRFKKGGEAIFAELKLVDSSALTHR